MVTEPGIPPPGAVFTRRTIPEDPGEDAGDDEEQVDDASLLAEEEAAEVAANQAASRYIRSLWASAGTDFQHEFTSFLKKQVSTAVDRGMELYFGGVEASFNEGLSFTFAGPPVAPADRDDVGEGSSRLEGVVITKKKERKDSRQAK